MERGDFALRVDAAYDRAATHGEAVGDHPSEITLIERPAMERMARSVRDLRVLCVGCGTGAEIRWALKAGAASVVGVDASIERLKLAQQRIGAGTPLVTDMVGGIRRADSGRALLVHGRIEELVLPDEGFDLVWSSLAFQHMAPLDAILASLWRALAPGGALLFSVPHAVQMGAKCDDASGSERRVLGYEDVDGERRFYGDYLRERTISVPLGSGGVDVIVRNTEDVVQAVLDAGFVLDGIAAPRPPDATMSDTPETRQLIETYERYPRFLIVRAIRP